MDISIINELKKISTDEIQLLNESTNKTITKEENLKNDVIKVKKYERFLKRDIKNELNAEIIYMVFGNSRHVIDEEIITLKEGELLFVNSNVRHKVSELGDSDIAIKISINQKFCDYCTLESDFLVKFFLNTMFNEDEKVKFLRFNIKGIKQVVNII